MKRKIKFKAKKIKPFSDNYTILRMLCFLFLTAIINHTLLGQENCEECQNPIVELKNLEIGDVASAKEDVIEMSKEFYGWEVLLGKNGISAFDVLQRGFGFLSELKKKNPCADTYYIFENLLDQAKRIGAKEGQAKFEIRAIYHE